MPLSRPVAGHRPSNGSASTSIPNAPHPYLSSSQAGWVDLTAEALLEPAELHGWERPATPDIRLMLFSGGPLRFDREGGDGSRGGVVVREGDLILRPGDEPYTVGWTSLSSAETRAFVLHLGRDLLSRTTEELDGRDPARISLPSRVGFRDPMLREICLNLWRELEGPVPAGRLYAQTAARLLAVHLIRNYTAAPRDFRETSRVLTQRQLRSVTDVIRSNLGTDLSLTTLAAEARLSPYHFARLFRQTTGASPHQFVLAQRLEKARCLLRETTVSLADVALEAGFASQSHLTSMFKRRFGLTPKAYREKA